MRAAPLVTPLAILLLTGSPAPAMLAVGDIAIVGANSSSANDEVAFVALAAIPAGQTISFTNSSWQGLGGGAFRTSEHLNEDDGGPLAWTSPSGGLPAGAVVTLVNDFINGVSTSIGSAAGAAMGLKRDGDQVFALQGTVSAPSFLTGVQFATASTEAFGVSTSVAANDFNRTNVPPGLTFGSTMLALDFGYVAGSASAKDNVKYAGPTAFSGATLAAAVLSAKSAIATPANWVSNDTAYSTFTPNFTFSVAAIPEPSPALFGALLVGGLGVTVARRPAPAA